MPSAVKGAAVGLAWFLAYMAVTKLVVKPVAAKYNVPVLKDL
jgi:hypothetical protein